MRPVHRAVILRRLFKYNIMYINNSIPFKRRVVRRIVVLVVTHFLLSRFKHLTELIIEFGVSSLTLNNGSLLSESVDGAALPPRVLL